MPPLSETNITLPDLVAQKQAKISSQQPAIMQKHCTRMTISEQSWVEVVESPGDLMAYREQWESLAKQTLEPNIFHEYWMLATCLKHDFHTEKMRFVFTFQRNKRETDPPILSGVFPLEVAHETVFRLPKLKLLTSIYSYLATPILHPQFSQQALTSLIEWSRQSRFSLLEFPRVQLQGKFHQSLIDVLNRLHLKSFVVDQHNRAILHRAPDAEAYQLQNISGHSRRDHRRLRRRLEELGKMEFRTIDQYQNLDYWVDQFLVLEQKGWKGERGTAIGQQQRDQAFFREITHEAYHRNQLQMMGLFLDEKPIALKCNLLSGQSSYAWKIAYDEQYSRYSPGVHLELENIAYLHEQTDLQWMDSCATEGHFMINRLWPDRHTIGHLLIPTGRFSGELYTAMRPLLRFCKRKLKSIISSGKQNQKQSNN